MVEINEFVSVIIPCRNEEAFIENVIHDVLKQDYPQDLMEIIIVDGMSSDNTPSIVRQLQVKNQNLMVLENPEKIVPTALNMGIRKSRGSVIVRLDAHCRYPVNYISYLVQNLIALDAGNVGVPVISKPKTKSSKALAIAESMGNAFGIGNSDFRTGSEKIQKTDTVPFGCFKRSVFDKIGFFDTDLIRNQDDEFNARMIKNGYDIYILPDISITYYTRDRFAQAAHMFYYYGLFKPLVNKKLGSAATFRQFVPPLFVLANFILLISMFFHKAFIALFLLMWTSYLIAAVLFSWKSSMKHKKVSLLFLMPICFTIFHFSYGFGYLKGILKFVLMGKAQAMGDISVKR